MSPTVAAFDPSQQNITVIMADGVTPVNASIHDLSAFLLYNTRLSISYGAQLSACLGMLIVTLILTKESKRHKPVYLLNVLSLFIGFLRGLFLALWSVSGWVDLYDVATGDFSRLSTSAHAISIMGLVMPILFTMTVDASLLLQAHAIIKTLPRKWYYAVIAMSCIVYLLAVGFRFAEAVTNGQAIMAGNYYFDKAWLQTATLVTEAIAIWYFSIIFFGKLVMILVERKNRGWQQLNYIQVLTIMGLCTMIIPCRFLFYHEISLDANLSKAIFASLEFIQKESFPEAGTWAMTLVALLLPLSSLWASLPTTERSFSFNISSLWSSRQSQDGEKTLGSQHSGLTNTFNSGGRKESTSPINPSTNNAIIEHNRRASSRDSTEIDLERMGVRVDRSYDVHSDRAARY